MRRITGTTIYTYVACPRAAELDLHEDRKKRRPLTEGEELSRQRGRELEALRTADLGYAQPRYDRNDYEAGARETLAFLRDGVAGVTQGVLADGDRLGIPDLLRKEAGASALGDFHYVVGDVKSSGVARADQVLQVAFYARLLEKVQGRPPQYGFLWLKDGREQRLTLAEFAPVFDDVLARVTELAGGSAGRERAFLQAACRRCHWSTVCEGELRAREDLSLVAGMTRGLRTTLENVGVARASDLCDVATDRLVKRAQLEGAFVRRLQLSARAWQAGEPLYAHDGDGAQAALASFACVHVLVDSFAEQLLCVGASWHEGDRARRVIAVPARADTEWAACQEVLAAVPASAKLLHWGASLPAWLQRTSLEHFADADLHGRLVDLARRVRGAVAFPAPVFGLRDAVLHGLGRDPDRAGDVDAAPLWVARADAEARLRAKMAQDLDDLVELTRRFLEQPRAANDLVGTSSSARDRSDPITAMEPGEE